MLTEKEKDELYEEFKERMTREPIVKRKTPLSDIRERHVKRWMKLHYGDDADKYPPPKIGLTDWNKITGLVAKALVSPSTYDIRKHPGMDKLAVEMAQELDDLYFKYLEKSWLFADQKGENDDTDGTDLAQDCEHGFEET